MMNVWQKVVGSDRHKMVGDMMISTNGSKWWTRSTTNMATFYREGGPPIIHANGSKEDFKIKWP